MLESRSQKTKKQVAMARFGKGCMGKQPPLNTTFKGEGRGREEGEGRGARQLSSLAVPGHPVKDTSRRPRRTWCAARGLTPSADAAMSAGFEEGRGGDAVHMQFPHGSEPVGETTSARGRWPVGEPHRLTTANGSGGKAVLSAGLRCVTRTVHHAHTYAPKEQRRPTGTFPLSRNQFHPG